MTQKHERIALAVAVELVAPYGLKASMRQGGKHPCIVIEGRGRFHKQPVSGSPRTDCEEVRNFTRQQISRWLRSIDIKPKAST